MIFLGDMELNTEDSEKSDIKVSEIGFGAWTIGLDWWGKKIEDDEAIRMLKRAFDKGINFFDTGDMCGREKVKS